VHAQGGRNQNAAGAVRPDMLFEAEQQALPPARLDVKTGEGFDPGAHRLPFGLGIHEGAAVGVRGEDERLTRRNQRFAMARRDGEPAFGVERDDGRPME